MKHISSLEKFLVGAFALFVSNAAIAQGPFNLGTIHPGDSVIIYYDVIINTPLVPPNAPSISNQGSVTVNGGPAILTDDPDTAPLADATVTPLNSFALPVVFGDFKAYQKLSDIEVAWKILTESNTLKYDVEKSSDGRTFLKIGEVTARGGARIINYAFLDINPFNGNNFYRLKTIDRDGAFKFSPIIKVVIGGKEMMNLYPNPVSDKIVNVELRNVAKGQYNFTLYSISGQKIYSTVIVHNGGSASQLINIPASVSKGLYHVEIKGGRIAINKTMLVD